MSQTSRRRARQRRWQKRQKHLQFKDSVRRLSTGVTRRFEGVDLQTAAGKLVKATGVVVTTESGQQVFEIESVETVELAQGPLPNFSIK